MVNICDSLDEEMEFQSRVMTFFQPLSVNQNQHHQDRPPPPTLELQLELGYTRNPERANACQHIDTKGAMARNARPIKRSQRPPELAGGCKVDDTWNHVTFSFTESEFEFFV